MLGLLSVCKKIMKKYKLILLASVSILVLGLLAFNTNPASAFVGGCSGTEGFSTTTGESCYLVPGCSDHSGFSSTTGRHCNTSSFIAGCSSTHGFSITTGMPCDGTHISTVAGCYSTEG